MAADRLTSAMLIGALRRRAEAAGGFCMVLAKGDETSGAILLQTLEQGCDTGLFERSPDYAGGHHLVPCGPDVGADPQSVTQYLARRRQSDPDLWIIELDIVQAKRFAAETIC
ncbi:MAG: DUF1491 family protein [Sphingobium sp.]